MLFFHLPLKNAVRIHNYSENYRCQDQEQAQTSYFGQTQVSIHMTILHQHSVAEIDGIQSTIEGCRKRVTLHHAKLDTEWKICKRGQIAALLADVSFFQQDFRFCTIFLIRSLLKA